MLPKLVPLGHCCRGVSVRYSRGSVSRTRESGRCKSRFAADAIKIDSDGSEISQRVYLLFRDTS